MRGPADLTLTVTESRLVNPLLGKREGMAFEGDRSVLPTLIGLIDTPDTHFPIVTP